MSVCGTRAQYQRGCRCQPCATAANEYNRRYSNARREVSATPSGFQIPASTRGRHGNGPGIVSNNVMASWRESAACTGNNPNLWDIDIPDGWTQAASICANCPVQRQCLTDHLGNLDAFGIYGGIPLWAGVPMTQKRETA